MSSTETHWAINLDEWSEESFIHLYENDEGPAGHFAVFTGTKEEAVSKCLRTLQPLVERMMYKSDDYGIPND